MKLQNQIIFITAMLCCCQQSIRATTTMQRAQGIIAQQSIPLIQPTYQAFNAQLWFQALPEFPVYKVMGDLLPNNSITPTTAYNFLLIDQSNPPVIFIDPNLEWVEKAYLFTRDNNLPVLNKFIVENMFFLGT